VGTDAASAAELLAETTEVRRLARRSTRAFTFPFFLYGTAALTAAGFDLVLPAAVGVWWALMSVAGGAALWRYYRARACATGVSAGWRRYALAWGAAAVGFALVFALGPVSLLPVLPWAVIGGTYVGLGATGDGPQMLAAGAGLWAVAATPLLGVPVGAASNGLAGGVLLAAGVASVVLSRRWPA